MDDPVKVWCLWCSDELISIHKTHEGAIQAQNDFDEKHPILARMSYLDEEGILD